MYENLVHNTSDGTIREKDFIYDTASGPLDHLKKVLDEEPLATIEESRDR